MGEAKQHNNTCCHITESPPKEENWGTRMTEGSRLLLFQEPRR